MPVKMNLICTVLVATILVIQLGFSTAQIQNALEPRLCWECDEDQPSSKPACPSVFDIGASTFTLNYTVCPTGQFYCMKTVSDAFSGSKVSRSCAESCKESDVMFGIGESVFCCTTDKCNGAVGHNPRWVLLVSLLGTAAWILN